MSHILSLLGEMRSRLGMYLGTPSITRLAAFLRGYDYAAEKIGHRGGDPFLADFRDWIQHRFQTTRVSWEDAILQHSTDEADGVRQFWDLLDEYLKEHPSAAIPLAPTEKAGAPGGPNGG